MKTILPILAWLFFLSLVGKELLLNHWEGALVMFAALALVSSGLELLGFQQGRWYWLTATGLCAAYLFFPNKMAPLAALPYLILSVWLTVQTTVNLLVFRKFQLREWVRLAALGYWATGAVWAMCFLADIRPFGFDPVIVGLTAAHFHVAGFVLATVVYCLISDAPTQANRLLGLATLAGMPLVATGITLTKLGFSPTFEWVSASCFVIFAISVAWQHIRLFSTKQHPWKSRLFWLGGSVCLLAGAVLATLYALRFSIPIQWVNIPNMKIWHGTMNAVGFGWMVIHGWKLVRTSHV